MACLAASFVCVHYTARALGLVIKQMAEFLKSTFVSFCDVISVALRRCTMATGTNITFDVTQFAIDLNTILPVEIL